MPLSLEKLQNMLRKYGMKPIAYFRRNDFCVYIQLVCLKNADEFLFYIPSKYEFSVRHLRREENVFKIEPVDLENDKSSKNMDLDELDRLYEEIDMGVSIDKEMKQQLENRYKKSISLVKKNTHQMSEIKNCSQQLLRFKYFVDNIPYKLCIFCRNYMCVLNRNNRIESYKIETTLPSDKTKLLVSSDLELLYEKNNDIVSDMKYIKTFIYSILNKNQKIHNTTFLKMIEKQQTTSLNNEKLQNLIKDYDSYIEQFEHLLETINEREKVLKSELDTIEKRSEGKIGMNSDLVKIHEKSKVGVELSKLEDLRKETIDNIKKVKNSRDDIVLSSDRLIFDSLIMMDTIINNFNRLDTLLD